MRIATVSRTKPITQKGISFDSRNRDLGTGETFICSIVPFSFSLTIFKKAEIYPANPSCRGSHAFEVEQRAVHKPLLILLALARIAQDAPRMVTFEDIEGELKNLLAEFGPSDRHLPQLYKQQHQQLALKVKTLECEQGLTSLVEALLVEALANEKIDDESSCQDHLCSVMGDEPLDPKCPSPTGRADLQQDLTASAH